MPTDKAAKRIEQTDMEAVAWFTRMNGEPSAQDREDFGAWLAADPAHEISYRAVEAMCGNADAVGERLAREEADVLAAHLRRMDEAKGRRRPRPLAPTIAAVLLLLVPGFWLWLERPHLLQDLTADHVAAFAERKRIELPDGTTVLLDADSAIALPAGDGAARRVALLRGTAFFDVRKAESPFIVSAGGGKIRVLGTQFDVAMRPDGVTVNLATGSVSVTSGPSGKEVRLQPGQRVRYGDDGPGPVVAVEVSDAMAWREGRYIFDRARLGDVMDEIQRYRGGRILVLDQELSDRRISGSLRLDDADAALASLQASVGFQAHRLGGRIVLIRP